MPKSKIMKPYISSKLNNSDEDDEELDIKN